MPCIRRLCSPGNGAAKDAALRAAGGGSIALAVTRTSAPATSMDKHNAVRIGQREALTGGSPQQERRQSAPASATGATAYNSNVHQEEQW